MKANPVITKVHKPNGASKVGERSAINPEMNPASTAVDRSSFKIHTIEKAR
jgi:hypothetical protein